MFLVLYWAKIQRTTFSSNTHSRSQKSQIQAFLERLATVPLSMKIHYRLRLDNGVEE